MKQLLPRLAGLAARVNASEQRILTRATARESEVVARLEKIRSQAMTDDDIAKEYQRLTIERATLAKVIAISQNRLN